MAKKILITGATGLVGNKLIPRLQKNGNRISILTRKPTEIENVKVFLWDVEKQQIDREAFTDIDTIIHLAGEGIATEKWTEKRKKQLIDSRVKSTELMYKAISDLKVPVKTFISASAVGFYGSRGEEILTEKSKPGNDFMADCCMAWENAVDKGTALGLRVAKIRIGVILSKDGGALASMDMPIKFFVGAPLGSGKQWIPWVHIDDIVGVFANAVESENFIGAYNATAPYPVTNKTLTKAIAKHIKRPIWPLTIPAFLMKAILGEMAAVVLMSTNTSSQKLLDSGYQFKYLDLDDALASIYNE